MTKDHKLAIRILEYLEGRANLAICFNPGLPSIYWTEQTKKAVQQMIKDHLKK